MCLARVSHFELLARKLDYIYLAEVEKRGADGVAEITKYSGVSKGQAGWFAKCSRCKDATGKKRKKHLGTFPTDVVAAYVLFRHVKGSHGGIEPRIWGALAGAKRKAGDEMCGGPVA